MINAVFQRLSSILLIQDTCHFDKIPSTYHQWPNESQIIQYMPHNMKPDMGPYMKSVFPYLPAELIEMLKIISPDPQAWFVGQFTSYLLRPRSKLKSTLEVEIIH